MRSGTRYAPGMWKLLVVGLFALAGCQTDQEQAIAAAKARQAAFHQKCVSYGFKPGTDFYAQCRQQFDISFAQEQAARRAMILQYMRPAAAPIYTPPAMQPIPAPSSLVNTYCYRVGNTVNCQSR